MFDSIYNKIRKDFKFLSNFGFYFLYNEHHYVMPSVVFCDGIKRLQIGMHYEDGRIFALLYDSEEQLCGTDLLENIMFTNASYNKQVQQVCHYLNNYFKIKK